MSTLNKSKIGYVSADLVPETIQSLTEWSNKYIPQKSLFTMEMGGKVEGGNVMDDAHLTLFFGIDEQNLDHKKLQDYLSSLDVKTLKIECVNTFETPQQGCKIIYLKVSNQKNKLSSIHNDILKFPHFKELQNLNFVPHITIAFVKEEFDERSIPLDNISELNVRGIFYHTKTE